ncbi:hypothetical protein ACE3MS_19970 [Paenibacillus dendritiformis]|uniref:hypothetical protein n=1 Tax=Paenibacillus dendritiformis TaxID=130049 RepID=UPI003646AB5A
MPLTQAFQQLRRNPIIAFVPMLLDLAILALSVAWSGWQLTSQWSYRIVLEMGLPSIMHLYNLPFSWAQLLLITVWSFAQGGYVKALATACEGGSVDADHMVRNSLAFWVPFLGLNIAMLLAKAAVSSLLIMKFGSIGAGASLLAFAVLRIVFIYLEFTIVTDRIHFDAAFRRSAHYFKQNWPSALAMAVLLLAASGVASLAANWFAAPAAVILIIVLYSLMMSLLQTALMLTLNEAKRWSEG